MNHSFHEVLFPEHYSFGSISSSAFQTDIVEMNSGFEMRNSRWSCGRRHYNLTIGPVKFDIIRDIVRFFEARQGMRYGFLFRDWLSDNTAHSGAHVTAFDEELEAIDDNRTAFRLFQTLGDGASSFRRRVMKPRLDGFLLGLDGTRVVNSALYTICQSTGVVRLAESIEPNISVSAGFFYHVPVRFAVDQLDIRLVSFETATIQNLLLTEIMMQETD